MTSRAKTIFINSLTSYGRMAIGFVIGLGITRIAMRVLGDHPDQAKIVFGTYAVLLAIVGFTTFINESLQQSMTRFLAIAVHLGDGEKVRRLFSTGWVLSSLFGLLVAGIISLAVPWILDLFSVPPPLLVEARISVYLIAAAHVLNSAVGPWQAALIAQDRYTVVNIAALVSQILTLGGVWALGWVPVSRLVGLTIAMLAPGVLVGLAVMLQVAVRSSDFRLRQRDVRRMECRELCGMAGWSTVATFACSFYERADQIMINLFLGPLLNAPYAVTAQLQGYVVRAVAAFTGVLLPSASRIATHGTMRERQEFFLRATRYGLAIAVPISVLIVAFRRQIIETWLGNGFEDAIQILPIAMAIIVVQSIAGAASIYVAAANTLKWPALAAITDGLFNILLSTFFVRVAGLGLFGILLGTLVTTTLSRGIFFTTYVARQVGISVLLFWRRSVLPIALAAAWMGPAMMLLERSGAGFVKTIMGLVIVGSLYLLWIWYVLFDEYERGLLSNFFARTPAASPPPV
jgi:O-antigen/teichoic acid export membrane protein